MNMDSGNTDDDAGNKDPGLNMHHPEATIEDFERHRHSNVYGGLQIPQHRRRRHRHQHRHHHRHSNKDQESDRPVTPPSQRVQFILGYYDDDDMHNEHPLFCEMETLCTTSSGELEWKETARWVKFEEDVEEGGERWSKPHVATLSLHSLFELRSQLISGCVILDLEAFNLVQVVDILSDNLVNKGDLSFENKEKFVDALIQKHKHLYEKQKGKENGNMSRLPLIRSLAEIGRNHSSAKNGGSGSFFSRAFSFAGTGAPTSQTEPNFDKSPSQGSIGHNQSATTLDDQKQRGNTHFMRKIPPGSEAANILVGEVDFVKKPISAFVRLSSAVPLGDITEVPVPTRFLFILLGPKGGISRYHEIGRAIATLLSDDIFHVVAYKSKNTDNLLSGIDEFLDAVTVLPPGEWDPAIRIEPPSEIPSQDSRKMLNKKEEHIDEEEEEEKIRRESGLTRSGRLFGGLINDIKRKKPWYLSDYKDGISMQSVAAFFFLYFACLTPIITFGGLLGDATGNNIASMESLVSGLICGVTYGLFSGQPLTILGSTGPVLVFETIIYDFCKSAEWDYLGFRFWIGIWATIILLLMVALDASAAVCYITRFTEENFATLIAVIFILKAIEKVIKIGDKYPMETNVDVNKTCFCEPNLDILNNRTAFNFSGSELITDEADFVSNKTYFSYGDQSYSLYNISYDDCKNMNGTQIGDGCPKFYSDVYLLSIILFFGTFIISSKLKNFKTASFFPTKVRCFISDFAVIIAILSMTILDFTVGIHTPKLEVPEKFQPTSNDRGWIVYPFGPKNENPPYTAFAAIVPALLACILLFMDQQITAVIVNRKEHLLKKGGGYHLDLFILALLILVNSIFGLPWFVAATVLSINHVNALKVESECAAPGEKPQFLGVRENRLTHVLIFLFIGLSVLMTKILSLIPMPVLYGVFLYMGISALGGIQLYNRILILFMPVKYQPDYAFLRQVPLKKVHLFTLIQCLCLGALWVIKSFSETSILFPLMLVVMVGIRKLLDCLFSQRELKILDDILPEFSRKEKLTDEEDGNEDPEEEMGGDGEGMVSIPLANGNVMKVPMNPINISEEVNKSGIWKDINSECKTDDNKSDPNCKRCSHRRTRKRSHSRRHTNGHVSPVAEEPKDSNEIEFGGVKKPENNVAFTLDNEIHFAKKRHNKKDAKNEEEKRRLSMMAEEDEENSIKIKVIKA